MNQKLLQSTTESEVQTNQLPLPVSTEEKMHKLRENQRQLVLTILKTVGSINQREASALGIWRLGARIFELRRMGNVIASIRECDGGFVRYVLMGKN